MPAAPGVAVTPPDIMPYRNGNTGIDYVTSFDSGRAGPHVVVNALTHGNEICGAIALDQLFRDKLRPDRGRLSLSFANVAAYQRFDAAAPNASRFLDEDFNRLWDEATLDGPRRSRELARARQLRPFFASADLLLDIHSMQFATAPLMLVGTAAKTLPFARRVGVPALIVADAGHAAGRRLRDHGAFGDPAAPQLALLVECGQHWQADSGAVALDTAYRFLAAAGVLAAEETQRRLAAPVPPQRVITVTAAITIASDDFRFVAPFQGLEVIPKAGTVIGHDGESAIVTPYDDCVLIMPARRPARGQTAVRLGRFTG